METRERYETTESPVNGHTGDSDAPEPLEWYEADRVIVHLILARKRGVVKVGEVNYLDPNQRPIALFADAEDRLHPWGTALEKFIAAAIEQAGKQP